MIEPTEFHLSELSRERLVGVDPALVRVVERAIRITSQDFSVIEGLRTEARQRQLVELGQSWTMDSRHLVGCAVDLHPYPFPRNEDGNLDWAAAVLPFRAIGHAMLRAAQLEYVALVWGAQQRHGGHWGGLNYMPHFELL